MKFKKGINWKMNISLFSLLLFCSERVDCVKNREDYKILEGAKIFFLDKYEQKFKMLS